MTGIKKQVKLFTKKKGLDFDTYWFIHKYDILERSGVTALSEPRKDPLIRNGLNSREWRQKLRAERFSKYYWFFRNLD